MKSAHLAVFLTLLAAGAVLFAACGGDDDSDSLPSGVTPTAAPDSLEAQLASILLTEEDIPEGLEASGLVYSTNEQVAGGSQAELDRLNEFGRQLGVDLTFVPISDLPDEVPVRGGIQNSASVYQGPAGAGQTFQDTVEEARVNDWEASYPEVGDIRVTELPRTVGDESAWFRITGVETCVLATPVGGAAATPVPSVTCPAARRVVDDYVLFRVGRVRSLVRVTTAFPADSPENIFEDEVQAWADLVAQRARSTFG